MRVRERIACRVGTSKPSSAQPVRAVRPCRRRWPRVRRVAPPPSWRFAPLAWTPAALCARARATGCLVCVLMEMAEEEDRRRACIVHWLSPTCVRSRAPVHARVRRAGQEEEAHAEEDRRKVAQTGRHKAYRRWVKRNAQ